MLVAGLGRREFIHLDFVELMAALDAADIAPSAHLLATEARCVGHVIER